MSIGNVFDAKKGAFAFFPRRFVNFTGAKMAQNAAFE